jgi:hypothetical protein
VDAHPRSRRLRPAVARTVTGVPMAESGTDLVR